MERMARDMAKRMVQVPLRGLKRAAWNHSSAVIGNFLLLLLCGDANLTFDLRIAHGHEPPGLPVRSTWGRPRRQYTVLDNRLRDRSIREMAHRSPS